MSAQDAKARVSSLVCAKRGYVDINAMYARCIGREMLLTLKSTITNAPMRRWLPMAGRAVGREMAGGADIFTSAMVEKDANQPDSGIGDVDRQYVYQHHSRKRKMPSSAL